MSEKSVAIVLSAGHGKRMHSSTAKQYLLIKGKPVIYYSLHEFEQCPFIDEVILVTAAEDIEYCRREIVERFAFRKVTAVVAGGAERYHSVYNGLCEIKRAGGADYVYIHDGARPFVSQEILQRVRACVCREKACVAAMPVKDTIKIADENGYCAQTPPRALVWQVQTPQTFSYPLVLEAYEKLMRRLQEGAALAVTDDAMVVEEMSEHKVKLVEGAYSNIKITTPEDMETAECLLKTL